MTVAKPLPHESARLHVTGTARYTDDVPAPAGCLHLAFGLSEQAAGTLDALDLHAVRAAPGVVSVLRAEDLDPMPDCSPSNADEPLLCTGAIHYAGQPLYLVIADTHLNARRAARLHATEVTEGTAILTIEEALAAGAWFDDGPRLWSDGDVEGMLSAAPHRLDGTFEIGGQEHFYLEGQAALALPGEGGEMHVLSSTQHPTEIQHKVADALGVPMHAVRSEVRRMGGGFGGKESQGNALAIACAVAARLTGKACRMRYDRDDDFVVTGKRHDFRIAYEVGHDAEGRVHAVRFRHWVRCGWSQDLSLPVADRAMLHADNAYDIPALEVTSWRLRTNTQSATAFRGFGGPQGMIGIERVMDHVAHATGHDPLAVRRLNFYADAGGGGGREGPAPRTPRDISTEKKGHTHYGQPVTDFCLNALVSRLAESCDYDARRGRVAEWNAGNPRLKRGIALTPVKFGISFTLTHLNQAGALVHVYADGSIHLNHGGTEMGQGLHSKVAQVAASGFGCDPARVRITATDTGKVPNTSATAASSGADLNGMAVKAACDTIRGRMADFLAAEHQAERADVVFEGDRVRVTGAEYGFEEVAARAYMARVQLSATGFYATPDISWDRQAGRGRPFYYFAYGASCSEVVVDTLTGENRILRTDILHDAGASLNPALDIGQVEGGFVQGAGWLTTEELVWDGRGRLRTHAPSTYKIPCASDLPPDFRVALWEDANREETIYRSKAVGEPPLMHGIGVFLALSDAIGACGGGYPDLDAPATAERVLAAIQRIR
ncbi:MAG: xanthine dehydrogenase molybdopterin binding subunit [Jannaschia sp.]